MEGTKNYVSNVVMCRVGLAAREAAISADVTVQPLQV